MRSSLHPPPPTHPLIIRARPRFLALCRNREELNGVRDWSNMERLAYGSRFETSKRPSCFRLHFKFFSEQIIVVFMSRFMAAHKKTCKVRVLVRLRPERPDYKERESGKRDGIPERCVRAIDSSTLELWNCRNSEESIRYR